MLVGEAWGEQEEAAGEPFVGPSGKVLNSMLRAAGIRRDECYLTNVFNFHPPSNQLQSLGGSKFEAIEDWPQITATKPGIWIRKQFTHELERLHQEVQTIRPNVIVALGNTPLWALTRDQGIKKQRGTPVYDYTGQFKVLPTYHPSAIMRQWKLRPVGIADLGKALRESEFPEIRRPNRLIHIPETIQDIADFYEAEIAPVRVVGCDIETAQIAGLNTITEVGFAPQWDKALVIPFLTRRPGNHNYWRTANEERQAWKWIQRILLEKLMAGQNFNYDLQYLWWEMKFRLGQVADDTMILHHSMYPEMEKGLGFLGSVYTDEPSWKFMRKDSTGFKVGE